MTDNGLSATSFLSFVTTPPPRLRCAQKAMNFSESWVLVYTRNEKQLHMVKNGEELRDMLSPRMSPPGSPPASREASHRGVQRMNGRKRGRHEEGLAHPACGPGPLNNVAVDGARELDRSLRDEEPNVPVCWG